MKRVVLTGLAAASLLLAACGGGDKNAATAPTPKQNGKGGVVQAVPSNGLLGPATTVSPEGSKTTGKTSPISPKENRPTDAESHGVAGGGACSSTSAAPPPANLGALTGTILCLLNAERAAKGLPALHSNGG